MTKRIPMNPRFAKQSAEATIKNVIDAIVELVTNSDDSYRRLEEEGIDHCGRIEIHISRRKGGVCEKLVVKDWAEGMTREKLQQAIEFAGETSGFEEGKSVRGMFGRGLKETIIALGKGIIKTVKDGKKHQTRLWWDSEEKEPLYDDEMLNRTEDTSEENGTEINIRVTNKRIKVPEMKTLSAQISNHYALRRITQNREVVLFFYDLKRKMDRMCPIRFQEPIDKEKVVDRVVTYPAIFDEGKDQVRVIVYESREKLGKSPRYDPFSICGILIKVGAGVLDNQLFKFDNDEAAFHFFGEAKCDCLENRIREGRTELIDFNRAGLDWRHDYCKELSKAIESVLDPLVQKKKEDLLRSKPKVEVKEPTKKMLKKLCSELNRIAKEELQELEGKGIGAPPTGDFAVKPEYANIYPVGKERSFSVYASKDIVDNFGKKVYIGVDETLQIRPLSSVVDLHPHHKYPNYYWGHFKVVGDAENAEGKIIASLGDEKAFATVKVTPPKKSKSKRKLAVKKGGFITDIRPDDAETKTGGQRSRYEEETGIIWVNVNFPSVRNYIKAGFEGLEKPEARMLLSEIVGETFCKAMVRKKMERGDFIFHPESPEAQVEAYNAEINDLQKEYLQIIQKIVFGLKLEKGRNL